MFDFQKDVIDRSFKLPVVVDFWAPWCGPCRFLTPVIEQIAIEQEGQWELVKINTEDHQQIATEFRIKSIPNVKMFYRGEVIDEFLGALPRQKVLDWLQKGLPDEGVRALDDLLSSVDEPSVEAIQELYNRYSGSAEIRLVYSQLILWDRPEEVPTLLEPIKMGNAVYDKAHFLKDIVSFLLYSTGDEELLDIQTKLRQANLEEATPGMIQVLSKNNQAADGLLAKAAIGLFTTLGMQHPLTKTYRKQLDMVLWV